MDLWNHHLPHGGLALTGLAPTHGVPPHVPRKIAPHAAVQREIGESVWIAPRGELFCQAEVDALGNPNQPL